MDVEPIKNKSLFEHILNLSILKHFFLSDIKTMG